MLDIGDRRQRCLVTLQRREFRCVERGHDRREPRRALRMMRTGIMVEARRMAEKRSSHRLLPIVARRLGGENVTGEI
ncbi:hypothetical protein G6F22_022152 [Rhizopus arrhizus]|nr:hypothetical protein G6F22_022152 [Rhizopus arrhizus]